MKEKFSFNLFGTVWKVKFVDKIHLNEDDSWPFGITNFTTHVILIAKKTKDNDVIPKSELRITLVHEILHAILDTGQYLEETRNEPMVEWMARCLIPLIDKNLI